MRSGMERRGWILRYERMGAIDCILSSYIILYYIVLYYVILYYIYVSSQ
jgi:hypothetical protein